MAWPGRATGHAIVVESSPRNGAVLQDPPREVELRFNSKLAKSLARVELVAGDEAPRTLPLPPASDSPERLVIPLPSLPPDNYTLRYKITAADGHRTLGALRFTVATPNGQ
jgi:methionine-rich copper-binding protein CopC